MNCWSEALWKWARLEGLVDQAASGLQLWQRLFTVHTSLHCLSAIAQHSKALAKGAEGRGSGTSGGTEHTEQAGDRAGGTSRRTERAEQAETDQAEQAGGQRGRNKPGGRSGGTSVETERAGQAERQTARAAQVGNIARRTNGPLLNRP